MSKSTREICFASIICVLLCALCMLSACHSSEPQARKGHLAGSLYPINYEGQVEIQSISLVASIEALPSTSPENGNAFYENHAALYSYYTLVNPTSEPLELKLGMDIRYADNEKTAAYCDTVNVSYEIREYPRNPGVAKMVVYLTLEAGQSCTLETVQPLYPSILPDYEPTLYRYELSLPSAQDWASIGTLMLQVRTPYYVIGCEPDPGAHALTKTEHGVTYAYGELHSGVLANKTAFSFDLSKGENPTTKDFSDYLEMLENIFGFVLIWLMLAAYEQPWLYAVYALVLLLAVFMVGFGIAGTVILIRVLRRTRKTKNKEEQDEDS